MDKLKIFVSHPPGGGGQFLCLLLISLQNPVTLIDKRSGHPQLDLISAGREESFQFSDQYLKYTSSEIDLNIGSQWLFDNFKFNNINRNYYTIHGFVDNFEVIHRAWHNAKIIIINPEECDLDQMYYNYIIKSMLFHQEWHNLKPRVLQIQQQYNRLHWVDANNIISYQNDIKLMCYIMKFGTLRLWVRSENNLPWCYWVKFKDVFNRNLINQLDDIIKFLDIKVTTERKQATIQLINEYAEAQKTMPWKLTIEDYT
jgi:hypothetical protein